MPSKIKTKEHPILFSSEMVRAVLDGRKSQTRRIIKIDPPYHFNSTGNKVYIEDSSGRVHGEISNLKCPYGVVGDRLWVREGWRCTGGGSLRNIIYRAEGDSAISFCGIDDGRTEILTVPESHWLEWDKLVYETNRGCNWRSPIHMFKWVARIWLEITRIRVERVQDISKEDAWSEGCLNPSPVDSREWFENLWDSLNAKRGYGWDKNPWVWVIEFERSARND